MHVFVGRPNENCCELKSHAQINYTLERINSMCWVERSPPPPHILYKMASTSEYTGMNDKCKMMFISGSYRIGWKIGMLWRGNGSLALSLQREQMSGTG